MRKHSEDVYLAIKAKTRLLIRTCGGLESAAAVTRSEKTSLSNAQHPDKPRYLMADEIADLEADCGQPIVSSYLAQLTTEDRACPTAASVCPGRLLEKGTAILKDLADFQAVASEASADGKIDDAEHDALIKEAQDLLLTATRLHDWLCNAKAAKRAKITTLDRRAG